MSIATEIRLRIKAEGETVLQGLGDKLNKIAANATVSSGKFSLLAGELRKVESTTVRSTNALKTYSASWRELAGSVDLASKEFKEATAEAARLDAQIAKAEGRNRKAGSRLKTGAQVAGTAVAAGIFGGPEAAIGAVAGGIAGGVPGAVLGSTIGATVSQLRQALSATASYEAEIKKLEIALRGVTTSQAEYNDALKFIQTSTNNYAVTQDILTRQFTKLQASVQGSGGSLQDTKIAFDGIVSAVRATGGSLQDVDSALTATAQVFSKGKVSAEELRQQIGERLPGAFTLFAKSMDMTPQQLDKALEDGKVSLQDFMVFAKALFDRYGENAKIIADSPAAAGDRLQIALSNLSKSIGVLLQPIGAAFQDTFTSIAKEITRATIALNNFFGVSGEALVKKNTLLIQAQTKVIKLNQDELARLAGRQGPITVTKDRTRDVAAGLDAIRISALRTNISIAEKQREKLRKEINDAQRDPLVLPTEDSKGLPGIDPGAGKKKTKPRLSLSDALTNTNAKKLEVDLSAQNARIQQEIAAAMRSGQGFMADILRDASAFQVIDIKLKAIETDKAFLLKNQAQFIKEGVKPLDIKQKLTALDAAAAVLKNERLKEEAVLIQKNAKLEEARMELELSAMQQIQDAKIAAGLISPEEAAGIQLKRTVDKFREQFADLINVDALSEQLRNATTSQAGKQIQEFITTATAELNNLEQVAINVSKGIGDAVGNSLANGITGLIEGTATAKEVFAGFLRDVGQILVQEGTRMIATYIAIGIARIFAGMGGGGNAASALGSNPNVAAYSPLAKGGTFANGIATFARGGTFSNSIVSSPTLFKFADGGTTRTGLMGEAGPEAIMPLKRGADGKLGVAANLDGAMSRYRRSPGTGGGGGEGGGTVEGGSAAAAGPMVVDVRYSVERINNVEYVTADQFQAGMLQAAQQGASQGEQRALRQLQQNTSVRGRVGLR
jgi:tape measure domain-containing protein